MNLWALLHSLVPGIARGSAQAGVLVGLIWGVQRLLHSRLTPAWRHSLWLLVVVRLLLPIVPASPFSVFNLARFFGVPPRSVAADVTTVRPKVSRPVFHTVAPGPYQPASPSHSPTSEGLLWARDTTAAPIPATARSAVPKNRWRREGAEGWFRLAALVWGLGAAGLLLRLGFGMIVFTLRIGRQAALADPSVLEVLEECRRLMAVRCRLTLIETGEVETPALFGWFRPKLLLPLGLPRRFSRTQLRHVFLHELAHLRRRDLPLNWLLVLLQAMHWFNPLVWFAFCRMRAERELACDALALSRTGPHEKAGYGETILRLLEDTLPRAAWPGLVGILEDKRQIQQRITMIARFQPTRRWSWLALLLMASLALVSLTDAKSAAPVSTGKPSLAVPSKGHPEKAEPAKPSRKEVRSAPAPTVTKRQLFTQVFRVDAHLFSTYLEQNFGLGKQPHGHQELLHRFLTSLGLKFPEPTPGPHGGQRAAYYNDRKGLIFVRAPLEELKVIERALAAFARPRSVAEPTLTSAEGSVAPAPPDTAHRSRSAGVMTRIMDAKLLYEMGHFSDAEAKLLEVLKEDPENRAAQRYLALAQLGEAKLMTPLVPSSRRSSPSRNTPASRPPNNVAHGSAARDKLQRKLNRIVLPELSFNDVPLPDVVSYLAKEALLQGNKAISFLLGPSSQPPDERQPQATLPPFRTSRPDVHGTQSSGTDQPPPLLARPLFSNGWDEAYYKNTLSWEHIHIRIEPPLHHVRFLDALDAIVRSADRPLSYSIQDWVVVFSAPT